MQYTRNIYSYRIEALAGDDTAAGEQGREDIAHNTSDMKQWHLHHNTTYVSISCTSIVYMCAYTGDKNAYHVQTHITS